MEIIGFLEMASKTRQHNTLETLYGGTSNFDQDRDWNQGLDWDQGRYQKYNGTGTSFRPKPKLGLGPYDMRDQE